jgi:FtsH-binding integral membrane protein
MRLLSKKTWLAIAVASAVAAGISAVVMVSSYTDGDTGITMISAIALAALAACSITAWSLMSKVSSLEKAMEEEEVICLRLKRPGIEMREEEIVPKGKMPKE